jgi:hypothetical protein
VPARDLDLETHPNLEWVRTLTCDLGHYYTFVRHMGGARWLLCDDSDVSDSSYEVFPLSRQRPPARAQLVCVSTAQLVCVSTVCVSTIGLCFTCTVCLRVASFSLASFSRAPSIPRPPSFAPALSLSLSGMQAGMGEEESDGVLAPGASVMAGVMQGPGVRVGCRRCVLTCA